jgi:NifU-like protein involved in Fe-S cluster formation
MDKLFLEDIIYRYKHPKHRARLSTQTHHAENLSCGDVIDICLEIEDGIVKSAHYDGQLCSIANYGADLLLENLIGQPIEAIGQINSAQLLGDFGVSLLQNPVRLKCFELAQLAVDSSSRI